MRDPLAECLERSSDRRTNLDAHAPTGGRGGSRGRGRGGRWFTDADAPCAGRLGGTASGEGPAGSAVPLCPFLYAGRRYDAETGLYYVRARYYDPDLGRFLSRDPLGYAAGANLYLYAGGNPAVHTDPDGEFVFALAALALAAAAVYAGAWYLEAHTTPGSGWNRAARFTEGVVEGAAVAAGVVALTFAAPVLALPFAVAGIGLTVFGLAELIAGNDFSGRPVDRWRMGGQLTGGLVGGLATARGFGAFSKTTFSAGQARLAAGETMTWGERFLYQRSGRWIGVVPEKNYALTGKRSIATRVFLAADEWWFGGAEQDAYWRSLSLKNKLLFEIGQKTLSNKTFTPRLGSLDPVARGRVLVDEAGGGMAGWIKATIPALPGVTLGVGRTFGTGPTPLVRWLVPRAAAGASGGIVDTPRQVYSLFRDNNDEYD